MLHRDKIFLNQIFFIILVITIVNYLLKIYWINNDKVKVDIVPKTNNEYKPATFGSIRFIDSYRFLSCSLDILDRTLVENSFKTLKH